MPDANVMLREDHRKVKELFRKFESTEDTQEKKAIADTAILELDIHARLEEEIYYPAVRKMSDDIDEIMNEAEEEHHVVEELMKELLQMKADDPMFTAKFTVMSENVEHHIDEEESEMLPKAAELGRETMEDLGSRMEQRKQELMSAAASSSRGGRRTNGSRSSSSRSTSRAKASTSRRSKSK
ncbi:MAG TPA: hemerythrin domain-containing protein [Dehalococcoidia bacterium]|nr:hemerythrin domain-containing protein [Dehalococcoidia bacterium]